MSYTQNQVHSNPKTYYYFDREMNQHETTSISDISRCSLARFQTNKRITMYLYLVNNPWIYYDPSNYTYFTPNGLGFVHRYCVICGVNRFEKDSDFSNACLDWRQSTVRCADHNDFYPSRDDDEGKDFSTEFREALKDKSNPQVLKKIFDDTRKKDGF